MFHIVVLANSHLHLDKKKNLLKNTAFMRIGLTFQAVLLSVSPFISLVEAS